MDPSMFPQADLRDQEETFLSENDIRGIDVFPSICHAECHKRIGSSCYSCSPANSFKFN